MQKIVTVETTKKDFCNILDFVDVDAQWRVKMMLMLMQ